MEQAQEAQGREQVDKEVGVKAQDLHEDLEMEKVKEWAIETEEVMAQVGWTEEQTKGGLRCLRIP